MKFIKSTLLTGLYVILPVLLLWIGLTTVLLPWTPASFAGSIKVVPKSDLQYLNCSIDEYSRSVSLMGVGVADCLPQSVPNDTRTES